MIGRRAGARGAASGRLGRLAQFVDRLVRAIAAEKKHRLGLFRRAEPVEFRPIELHFLAADQLIHVDARIERADGEPVGLGDIINMIRCDHRSRARHVLHHDAGIAGDMFAQIGRDVTRPKIVQIARLAAADDAHGFALEKVRLGVGHSPTHHEHESDDRQAPHQFWILDFGLRGRLF